MIPLSSPTLAPIYLDNEPVPLADEPRPNVAQILAARGRQPEGLEVVRLRFMADAEGRPLRPDDTIDRTLQTSNPVYLRTRRPGEPLVVPVPAAVPAPPHVGTAEPAWPAAVAPGDAPPRTPFPMPARPNPTRPGGPPPRPRGPLPLYRPPTARSEGEMQEGGGDAPKSS